MVVFFGGDDSLQFNSSFSLTDLNPTIPLNIIKSKNIYSNMYCERDLAFSLGSNMPFLKRTCSGWEAVCMYSRYKLLVLILCSSPAVLSLTLTETIIKLRGSALPQPATGACMGNASVLASGIGDRLSAGCFVHQGFSALSSSVRLLEKWS